jgi:AraC-like DNA-binding protein
MFDAVEIANRNLLRARDEIDRNYRSPLRIPELAAIAHCSTAHFSRMFTSTFGETPHRFLQRRRIERAMYLLRTTDSSVTDICMAVGWSSLGTFSRTFTEVVGESPTTFRDHGALPAVPSCFVQRWTRPATMA